MRIREGFAPGLVYRVTVLPVIKDMFGNALQDPFDLVFSTGGEIVPNVVAGMVEDRVTGEATRDARVAARFVLGDDTVTHWNVSDTGGVFSLRYVPAGSFEVWAWQDMNRDGEVGGSEPQTSFVPGELVEAPDTTLAIPHPHPAGHDAAAPGEGHRRGLGETDYRDRRLHRAGPGGGVDHRCGHGGGAGYGERRQGTRWRWRRIPPG